MPTDLTVCGVNDRVARVRSLADGTTRSSSRDAAAHAEEDELHLDVLRAIAAGAPDPVGLASAALKTAEIDFARWYE